MGPLNGLRKPDHVLHILHIMHILHLLIGFWIDDCQSAIVYNCSEQAQVMYVIPVTSILGRLPVVPVGEKRTIPFDMRRESAFPELSAIKARTVVMDVSGGT